MSRIDSARLALNLDWNDISDILDITLKRLEPHQKKHPVTVICPENIPFIRVDYSLISQAIYCIVHNSLVHTPDATPVCIKVSRDKELIIIIIEDDGPGLPESDIYRIFDKFFRVDKTQVYGGLGLGLSISKGIIELHSGHITAENKQPSGALFAIYLPVEMKEKE
jgi:two-component system sensor histidine kinase KdpD